MGLSSRFNEVGWHFFKFGLDFTGKNRHVQLYRTINFTGEALYFVLVKISGKDS